MKNFFVFASAFIVAGIIFSSCNKNTTVSVIKRHYRNGYYIGMNSGKTVKQNSKNNETAVTKNFYDVSDAGDKSGIITSGNETQINTETAVASLNKSTKIKAAKPALNSDFRSNAKTKVEKTKKEVKNAVKPERQNIKSKLRHSNVPAGSNSGAPMWVIVLFAIFIPPLGVALKFGIGREFWIDLLLTFLFFLPGMIYALIVVLD